MPQEASSPPGGEKPQLSIGVPNAVVETNHAKDLFKMTIPPLCGTIVQIFFLPRTGLNKSWVPLADSPIMYFRGKGAIWSRFSSSVEPFKVPPTTSFSLISNLVTTAKQIGVPAYYRQLWPAGRLLIAANGARYGSQIGLKENRYWRKCSKLEKLSVRILTASSVEYMINGPFALPYTAGAAKITPLTLMERVKGGQPPLQIPVGKFGPAPGGIPRLLLKGCQISIQFEIAMYSQFWTPKHWQEDYPVFNAFLSGVAARSIVEVITVPLRNIGNFRNIGFSTREAIGRTLTFPLLGSGINVVAKGLSFGIAIALIKVVERSWEDSKGV